jgi:hypothetical protein
MVKIGIRHVENPKPRIYIRGCVIWGVMVLGGCSSTPKPPSENGGMFRERNEGFSLLYRLMSDESKVSEIFILKHADDPVKGVVKEIAAASAGAKKEMDGFPQLNQRIEFDVPDLPRIEQESRDLEAKAEAKDLLTSSGTTFELRLIFTQAEAMGYAKNLCDALIAHEDDAQIKRFLTDLSRQCAEFERRLMDLLAVK